MVIQKNREPFVKEHEDEDGDGCRMRDCCHLEVASYKSQVSGNCLYPEKVTGIAICFVVFPKVVFRSHCLLPIELRVQFDVSTFLFPSPPEWAMIPK